MPELHRKATWNPVRDLWETDQTVLLSEHSAAYSETLPASGMTRNGVLFERPKSEHPTSGPVSSCLPTENALLRTPCAAEAEGGPLHPDTARERGQTLRLTGQILAMTGDLLPTPMTSYTARTAEEFREQRRAGNGARREKIGDLRIVVEELLPTGGHLLPTPMVGSTSPAAHGQISGDFRRRMDEALAQFGRFAPAIRRWEQVTGHPAPSPTEPTGRGGAHRLSARFAEWMMGLIPGWVTDIPISRTEQLRAIGNGVVPQQAVAALRDMHGAFETTTERKAA